MCPSATNSYTWHARNQVTAVTSGGTTSTFAYEAVGRRQNKTVALMADSPDWMRQSEWRSSWTGNWPWRNELASGSPVTGW